jgi:hypothetical protein
VNQVQDHIEVTDYDPARAVRVKKMIWSEIDRAFLTQYFVRVCCRTISECADTVLWLEEEFGSPQYQGTWWQDPADPRRIWLAHQLATFWQLRWGDR